MDQDRFGKFIKEIRKQNNLTQKELADKYNVTYQAVSKWENGKNMPDISLIKKMSEDFQVSIDEMMDVKTNNKDNDNSLKYVIIFMFVLMVIILSISVFFKNDGDFKFKTLVSSCNKFKISGNIAYNDLKSSIYIANIEYCGGDDKVLYNEIECILYESNVDTLKEISSYNYNEEENITLEEFLKMVTITVDDYKKSCKEYTENSLYLLVNAKDDMGKITTYEIPLSMEKSCNR